MEVDYAKAIADYQIPYSLHHLHINRLRVAMVGKSGPTPGDRHLAANDYPLERCTDSSVDTKTRL